LFSTEKRTEFGNSYHSQGDCTIMDELQPPLQTVQAKQEELLYFWALGDLHYLAHPAWQALHTPRLSLMFQDLRQLWAQEGAPAFCVSPGDIIEKAAPQQYQLARQALSLNLGAIPFYPGLGNHELSTAHQESEAELLEDFTIFWEKPPRYYWLAGQVLCIMLDVVGYPEPVLTHESLVFLETALAKHPQHIAIVFAHCPLYGTVLDRDEKRDLDYDSLQPYFYLENSEDVRAILARHANACLYICGHTHSGWQAPNLVLTKEQGGHPLTTVNLLSPWYTGKHHGIEWLDNGETCKYCPDEPDIVVSLAVHVYCGRIHLRLRDHRAKNWLAEWTVPTR
jgi:calcineurin-like phosphoesterase family protein